MPRPITSVGMRRPSIALAACLAIATPARADVAEIATTRPAMTERDVDKAQLDFEQRVVVDAYQADGHHDPAWDGDVHAFLPAQVRDGLPTTHSLVYGGAVPALSAYDRTWLARRIARGGCDDPVVLYEASVAIAAAGDKYSAAEMLFKASENAVASRYAPVVQLRIVAAMIKSMGNDGAAAPVPARLTELIHACLVDRATLPADRRAVWATGASVFEEPDMKRLAAIGDTIELRADADPWLFHTLMGRVEIARAWIARGNAENPTGDEKDAFAAHLAAARSHLLQAIAADDLEPEPFVAMISVGAADGSDTARGWLDLALARQVDDAPAFRAYLATLLRAHASIAQMLQVGNEAVAAGRFDTLAPWMLIEAADTIEGQLPTRAFDAAQLAEVYPPIVRCLDGYIAHSESPRMRLTAHMFAAAWAARLGKWDEAEQHFAALSAMETRPEPQVFAHYHLDVADAQRRAAATLAPQP